MKLSTFISRRALRALNVIIPAHDIRYYLMGIHVELHPGCAFLVATDGHRLGAYRDDGATTQGLPDGKPVSFIIPAQLVAGIKSHRTLDVVALHFDTETGAVTLDDCGTAATAPRLDGTFPDWRRVMPDVTDATEPSTFNPAYVGDFAKVARELRIGTKSSHPVVYIAQQGNNAAPVFIEGAPEFRGVLMPIRKENADIIRAGRDEWLTPTEPAQQRKAA